MKLGKVNFSDAFYRPSDYCMIDVYILGSVTRIVRQESQLRQRRVQGK